MSQPPIVRYLTMASKMAVFVSAVAGIFLQAVLGSRTWDWLLATTGVAMVITALTVRRWPSIVWTLVLGIATLVPVIFLATVGEFLTTYHALWFGALLGALAGSISWSEWKFPPAWRLPLVFWALTTALLWPVVIWREADFTWSALGGGLGAANANSGIGGPPPVVAAWVLTIAVSQLLGLLFFEWALSAPAVSSARGFRRRVILPVATAILIGAVLAAYQGTVNVWFLNDHQWPEIHRAGGSLLDGDAAGALMGFWTSAFAAIAISGGIAPLLLGFFGGVVAYGGIWATGSRMALLSGLIGASGIVLTALRFLPRRTLAILVAALVLASGLSLVVAHYREPNNDPIHRILKDLPELSATSIKKFAKEQLFNRGAPFGTVSVRMVVAYPVAGVGIGAFEELFSDFGYRVDGARHWPDNAQSWYRHQFAELGVVGSLGWVWWLGTLAWLLVKAKVDRELRAEGSLVLTSLAGISVVSVAAMPTRSAFVGFCVWIFVAWFVSLSADARQRLDRGHLASTTAAWAVLWVVAIGLVGATYLTGLGSLRPPARAVASDWIYQRGLSYLQPERGGRQVRWTDREAVTVVPPGTGNYLQLIFRADHPDIGERPVRVQVWRGDQSIGQTTLVNHDPQTWFINIASAQRAGTMFTIRVDRTWDASSAGGPPDEGLVLNDWTYVDAPPRGGIVIR